MADKEQMFSSTTVGKMASSKEQDFEEDSSLPPVRSSKVISVDGKVSMQCLELFLCVVLSGQI